MKKFLKAYCMEMLLILMILGVVGILWYRETTFMASIVAPQSEKWQAATIDDKKIELIKVRNKFVSMHDANNEKTKIMLGDVSGKLRPYLGETFRMVWSRNELFLCSLDAGSDFVRLYLSAGLCLEIDKRLTKDYADLVKTTKGGKSLKNLEDEVRFP